MKWYGVGLGGAGGNIIDTTYGLMRENFVGVSVFNTAEPDKAKLSFLKERFFLFGDFGGAGVGSKWKDSRDAISQEKWKKIFVENVISDGIAESQAILLTSSTGGGTGSGAIPIVSDYVKEILSPLRRDYDFILLDCGPNLGLITVNALVAATEVLIPLLPEYLPLRGMGLLLETIRKIKKRLNPGLRILGILGTMYDGRTIHSREVLAEVRSLFGERVFDVVVKKSIRFAEAPVARQPILEYAPRHPGAQAYRELAEVIIHGS
jgi:nitrogenase subunit NifH